ncbi:MAG: hypothetical protein HKN09_06205 [Saprospiraceae bacterium]|nr:hypothetical protein [Saprospiraceae bacterium]
MRNGKILGICIYLTFIFCSYALWEKQSDPNSKQCNETCSQLSIGLVPLIWDKLADTYISYIKSKFSDKTQGYNCREEFILDCNDPNYLSFLNGWIDSLNHLISNPEDHIDINQVDISELFKYCDSQISFEIIYTSEHICEGAVRIEDNTGPSIECDSMLILFTQDNNAAEKYSNYLDHLPIQDCTSFTYSSSIDPNTLDISCFPDTILDLSIYAIDNCGNRSACQTSISVLDTTEVRLVCPGELIIDCGDPEKFNTLSRWFENVQFDPTGAGSAEIISHIPISIELNEVCAFTKEVVWEGVDYCSKIHRCSALITIKDESAPNLNCPDTVVMQLTHLDYLESELNEFVPVDAYDVCNNYTLHHFFKEPLVINNCDSIISKELIVEAIDVCSNKSTCRSTLIIDRNIKPEISCPKDLQIQCQVIEGEAKLKAWINTADAFDFNDNRLDIKTKPALQDIVLQGCEKDYQVSFFSVDNCGQKVECISTIKVIDSIPPTIICPAPLTLDLNEKSYESLIREWEEGLIVQEECNAFSIQSNFPERDNINICVDSLEVVFSVTDECDNSAQCTSVVYFTDDNDLMISCPESWRLKCENYDDPDVMNGLFASVEVNTNINYELYWETEGINGYKDCENTYTEIIRFIVVDECNNEVHCSTILEWQAKLNIYIPNIISRQAASPNDGFMIFSNQKNLIVEDLFIYNKWGNLVFEQHNFPTNDYRYKWKGMETQNDAVSTVFTYMVKIKDLYGEKFEYIGTISLIN